MHMATRLLSRSELTAVLFMFNFADGSSVKTAPHSRSRHITMPGVILQFICLIFDQSEDGALAFIPLLHFDVVSSSGCIGLLWRWLAHLLALAILSVGDDEGRHSVLLSCIFVDRWGPHDGACRPQVVDNFLTLICCHRVDRRFSAELNK